MKTYDLFCDASIDLETNVACAGCVVVENPSGYSYSRGIIQENATNNSSEVLAIWLGVRLAIEIRNKCIRAGDRQVQFRLFSDSKISLCGIRDWIYGWIKRKNDSGQLINTSGNPVANQKYFIDIYNSIVYNNLHIEFYHQRGHICIFDDISLKKAADDFKSVNRTPLYRLGIDAYYISKNNNVVDSLTRDIVHQVSLEGMKSLKGTNFSKEGLYPLEFDIMDKDVSLYRKLTSNGINNL